MAVNMAAAMARAGPAPAAPGAVLRHVTGWAASHDCHMTASGGVHREACAAAGGTAGSPPSTTVKSQLSQFLPGTPASPPPASITYSYKNLITIYISTITLIYQILLIIINSLYYIKEVIVGFKS